MVKQCYENTHESWKALIDKYELLDERKDILNEVTNRWKSCRIKDTSQDPDIWFNELFNLKLKFNKIKVKYDKDEDDLKEHVFDVLPEDYRPVRLS